MTHEGKKKSLNAGIGSSFSGKTYWIAGRQVCWFDQDEMKLRLWVDVGGLSWGMVGCGWGRVFPLSSPLPLRATLPLFWSARGVWLKARSCIIWPLKQRGAMPLLPSQSPSSVWFLSPLCLISSCWYISGAFLSFVPFTLYQWLPKSSTHRWIEHLVCDSSNDREKYFVTADPWQDLAVAAGSAGICFMNPLKVLYHIFSISLSLWKVPLESALHCSYLQDVVPLCSFCQPLGLGPTWGHL